MKADEILKDIGTSHYFRGQNREAKTGSSTAGSRKGLTVAELVNAMGRNGLGLFVQVTTQDFWTAS